MTTTIKRRDCCSCRVPVLAGFSRGLIPFVLLLSACGGQTLSEADPGLASYVPGYQKDIQPILRDSCARCHASYGPRLGGVELDRYDSAYAGRVRNVCTAITQELVQQYEDALRPVPRDDPPTPRPACDGWEVYSMPTGAEPRLTDAEQLMLVRWVATGAKR